MPVRYGVLGALWAGVAGCLAGLVIGLRVHPATAWAAMVEVGLPAAFLGAVLGLVVGAVTLVVRAHLRS